jgi:hypothetical protein
MGLEDDILNIAPIITDHEEIEQGILQWLGKHRNPGGFELYAGKYVALSPHKIITAGDSPDEVLAEANRQGVKRPLIQRVPGFVGRQKKK